MNVLWNYSVMCAQQIIKWMWVANGGGSKSQYRVKGTANEVYCMCVGPNEVNLPQVSSRPELPNDEYNSRNLT